ncbi:unnamed protein product [Polarella glacialis]|uniref:Uncharacterized protein n=1 Tax=Polarella glacialis TaxID=89957 RepID=A0A813HYC7_POLGL|nr:unnamed protein product [Polarella glacialis]
MEIFNACIVSKLMYCIHTAWLNVAERRRLDAFQNKCLRKVMGVKHSFYSRVTNQSILQQAGSQKLSVILLKRQLQLLHHIALTPEGDILRNSVFQPNTFAVREPTGPKPRGRPRNTWAKEVLKHAISAAGGQQALAQLWHASKATWRNTIKIYCDSVDF